MISRPLHMALALPWVFLYLAKSRAAWLSGMVMTVLGIAACLYIVFNQSALGDQYGYLQGPLQIALAVVLLLVTLDMARRAISWPLPLVALLALLYGLFGDQLPGEFGHPGIPLASFLGTLTIAEGGLWGSLTGVSVSVVAVFVIFGAVLNAGEAGQGFMNLAVALAGRQRGGAAKVSVLASAFFGSISGSASANVASTGAITLPTMRKLGYPPAFAGAVEAVASSGGQIMPPLMGAGAFVMVELLGIPYVAIIQAALLPANLYFIAVWLGVNAFATRYDLRPLAAQDRVSSREVLITGMFFALPFTILLERMFNGGYTPQFAAALAIIAGFFLLLFGVRLDFSLARFGQRLLNLTHSAGAQIATIAAIILCASIVIGVLGQTGLGVKITSAILAWSGDQLWIALLLTALACLILGMEVPTTAAYVICVSVAGPALQKLGLAPLQAHLFVFWFALLSTITPPVCGAVFIAAGMVEENWLKVANKAMALGIGLYLIPLAFIANPSLIELAQQPLWALIAAIKIGLALWGISFAIITRGQPLLRLGIGALSLCLMFFLGI